MVSVRTLFVVFGLLALITGAAIFGGLVPLSLVPFANTDTNLRSIDGLVGIGNFPPDRSEALSSTRYITSWNGEFGEQMVGGGGVRWDGFAAGICQFQLEKATILWVRSDQNGRSIDVRGPIDKTPSSWPLLLSTISNEGDEWHFGGDSWTIAGQEIGSVSYLITIHYAKRPPGTLGCLTPGEWTRHAEVLVADEALLVSGIGNVFIVSPQPVQVGNDIVIGYDVGVATSVDGSGGWTLQILTPADEGGSPVPGAVWSPADNTATEVRFTVTSGMFSKGSSNMYQVKLKNTIIDQKDIIVVTIDFGELAPGQPSLTWTSAPARERPQAGDTIVLAFQSEPNSITGNAIQHYVVALFREGRLERYEVSAETYQFTVGSPDSNIDVTVVAFDGERSSAPSEVTIVVDPNIIINPPCPTCVEENPSLILFFVFLISIAAMLSLALWFFLPLGPRIKLMLIFAMIIVLVLAGSFLITGKLGF